MLHHAKERTIPVSGGTMLCISFGHGPCPLVILPGLRFSSLKGTGLFLSLYYRKFTEIYTVYVFDRPAPVQKGCTIHDLSEQTAEAMEALGIHGADIYAASQGGMIAMDLAIHHPDLVHAMVLAVTASRANPVLQDAIRTWIGLVERKDDAGLFRDYAERGYSEAYLRKYGKGLGFLLSLQKCDDRERFAILAESCLSANIYEKLGELRCPVLVLGGADDRIVSAEASREIAEKLHCPMYLYEGMSHEAYNEAPDFNARVYEFLRAGRI
ncbi:MAG: alpha/beta hydrolase [Solobacterium sp.]|nr:alpha/beta hydrolase [Solobacterium sp.]